MLNQFSRQEIILGGDATKKLANSRVCVFGIGGVGGYSVEALARAGVGTIGLVDDDKVCLTNINRQLHASFKTIGKYKTAVAAERAKEINPKIKTIEHSFFYTKDTADKIDLTQYDYLIDAIDTVACKLELIERAGKLNISLISCMGAGNKLDPTAFEVADIFSTSVCPLAKVIRHELKKRNITKLKVVYSKEVALTPDSTCQNSCNHACVCPAGTARKCTVRRQIPGSVSFVPSVAGLILAGEVIKNLIK